MASSVTSILLQPLLIYVAAPSVFPGCPACQEKKGAKELMNTEICIIWDILHLPPNIFITRLTMSVVPTWRVRFRIASKAKLLCTAAYKEPLYRSLPFLPHQWSLAASLEATLGTVQLNREQLRAAPVKAHLPGKCSHKTKEAFYSWIQFIYDNTKVWLTGRNGVATVADTCSCPKFGVNMKLLLKISGDALNRHRRSGCSLWLLLFGKKVCLRCGRAASREINPSTQDVKCAWVGSQPHWNLFKQDRGFHAFYCVTHAALQKFILKTNSC